MSDDGKTLRDLDRAEHLFRCDAWDRNVPMRPLSAADAMYFGNDYVAMIEGESEERQVLRFYATLLSKVVTVPKCDAAEWLSDCTLATLTELGNEAMRINDMVPPEKIAEQKKTVPAAGIDSSST